MGIEIDNFLDELKKLVFIKTKIIDGIEKRVGFDFEEKAYELVNQFLTSCNWKAPAAPVFTATQISKDPREVTSEEITEAVGKIQDTAPAVDAAMQKIIDEAKARTEQKTEPKSQQKEEKQKVKVEVPDEFTKAIPEPNASFPPTSQKETVGSCDQYFKQHGIKAYKTPEWYAIKFDAYLIPKSMYENVENLHDLHRRWLGPIDSNGKFILWQFAWIKYNHENGKSLFENTFVVDKTRLTKYYQDDVLNHRPSADVYLKDKTEVPEIKEKVEEKVSEPSTEEKPLPLKPRKKKEADSIKPPAPIISGGTGEKKSVNFD
jgi:hypothetical protein